MVRYAQREINEKAMKSLAPIKVLDPAEEKRMKEEAEMAARKIADIEAKLAQESANAAKANAVRIVF